MKENDKEKRYKYNKDKNFDELHNDINQDEIESSKNIKKRN